MLVRTGQLPNSWCLRSVLPSSALLPSLLPSVVPLLTSAPTPLHSREDLGGKISATEWNKAVKDMFETSPVKDAMHGLYKLDLGCLCELQDMIRAPGATGATFAAVMQLLQPHRQWPAEGGDLERTAFCNNVGSNLSQMSTFRVGDVGPETKAKLAAYVADEKNSVEANGRCSMFGAQIATWLHAVHAAVVKLEEEGKQ